MLTETNYAEAISILRHRFGNKQQIISKHMDILMETDVVTSPNNVKALRHFHDVVESNVRSLKAAAKTYGSLLASVLMNKLPNDLRLIIGRKIGELDWQLDTIMTELLQEPVNERTHCDAPARRGEMERHHQQLPLCFWEISHTAGRVAKTEERKQLLMKTGRCFMCLRKGHLCRSKQRCNVCGGKHHFSICTSSGQTESATTGLNPASPPFNPRRPHRHCW